jgi:UDP:flavonoid glycosyltransferase YjiC (YdhE family)
MVFGQRFFHSAAQACALLGRRGVLLTRYPEQLPAKLPAGVIHCDYAPFSQLLRRATCLVHHGGIGSTSQALAAGIPQLIMPMAHDQYDNAARIQRLGLGMTLATTRFTPRRLARQLSKLLENHTIVHNARTAATRLEPSDGIGIAVREIENELKNSK